MCDWGLTCRGIPARAAADSVSCLCQAERSARKSSERSEIESEIVKELKKLKKRGEIEGKHFKFVNRIHRIMSRL